MNIKKGDNVIVLTGRDKGKHGKVLKVLRQIDKAIVEGINVVKKHQRARKSNEKGQILNIPSPIHISNIRVDK